jgi:rod shape-determining protein MreD
MTPYLFIPLLLLAALLQATLLRHLPTSGYTVDLVLLLVVAWGILREGEATLWGLVGGIILDFLTGAPFGVQTISLGAIGLLNDLMAISVFRTNILFPLIAAFVATIIYDTIALLALQIFGFPVAWTEVIVRVTLPSAIVNTIAMPVVYVLLRWYNRRARPDLGV